MEPNRYELFLTKNFDKKLYLINPPNTKPPQLLYSQIADLEALDNRKIEIVDSFFLTVEKIKKYVGEEARLIKPNLAPFQFLIVGRIAVLARTENHEYLNKAFRFLQANFQAQPKKPQSDLDLRVYMDLDAGDRRKLKSRMLDRFIKKYQKKNLSSLKYDELLRLFETKINAKFCNPSEKGTDFMLLSMGAAFTLDLVIAKSIKRSFILSPDEAAYPGEISWQTLFDGAYQVIHFPNSEELGSESLTKLWHYYTIGFIPGDDEETLKNKTSTLENRLSLYWEGHQLISQRALFLINAWLYLERMNLSTNILEPYVIQLLSTPSLNTFIVFLLTHRKEMSAALNLLAWVKLNRGDPDIALDWGPSARLTIDGFTLYIPLKQEFETAISRLWTPIFRTHPYRGKRFSHIDKYLVKWGMTSETARQAALRHQELKEEFLQLTYRVSDTFLPGGSIEKGWDAVAEATEEEIVKLAAKSIQEDNSIPKFIENIDRIKAEKGSLLLKAFERVLKRDKLDPLLLGQLFNKLIESPDLTPHWFRMISQNSHIFPRLPANSTDKYSMLLPFTEPSQVLPFIRFFSIESLQPHTYLLSKAYENLLSTKEIDPKERLILKEHMKWLDLSRVPRLFMLLFDQGFEKDALRKISDPSDAEALCESLAKMPLSKVYAVLLDDEGEKVRKALSEKVKKAAFEVVLRRNIEMGSDKVLEVLLKHDLPYTAWHVNLINGCIHKNGGWEPWRKRFADTEKPELLLKTLAHAPLKTIESALPIILPRIETIQWPAILDLLEPYIEKTALPVNFIARMLKPTIDLTISQEAIFLKILLSSGDFNLTLLSLARLGSKIEAWEDKDVIQKLLIKAPLTYKVHEKARLLTLQVYSWAFKKPSAYFDWPSLIKNMLPLNDPHLNLMAVLQAEKLLPQVYELPYEKILDIQLLKSRTSLDFFQSAYNFLKNKEIVKQLPPDKVIYYWKEIALPTLITFIEKKDYERVCEFLTTLNICPEAVTNNPEFINVVHDYIETLLDKGEKKEAENLELKFLNFTILKIKEERNFTFENYTGETFYKTAGGSPHFLICNYSSSIKDKKFVLNHIQATLLWLKRLLERAKKQDTHGLETGYYLDSIYLKIAIMAGHCEFLKLCPAPYNKEFIQLIRSFFYLSNPGDLFFKTMLSLTQLLFEHSSWVYAQDRYSFIEMTVESNIGKNKYLFTLSDDEVKHRLKCIYDTVVKYISVHNLFHKVNALRILENVAPFVQNDMEYLEKLIKAIQPHLDYKCEGLLNLYYSFLKTVLINKLQTKKHYKNKATPEFELARNSVRHLLNFTDLSDMEEQTAFLMKIYKEVEWFAIEPDEMSAFFEKVLRKNFIKTLHK